MTDETPGKDPVEKFLYNVRKTFQMYSDAWAMTTKRQLEDLRFYALEQWDPSIRSRREQAYRPCLTEDHLTQMVKQVVNEERKNRPAIVVHPVDSGADIATAEVLSGILRHIQVSSKASIAYDTATEAAVVHGRGYVRVLVDYESPTSFNQEIRIERVRNPFTIFPDPSCQQPDYSDQRGCFIVDVLPREEAKKRWPKAKFANGGEFEGDGADTPGWINEDSVRVAEYFYICEKEIELALLDDGSVAPKDEVEDETRIVKTRKTLVPRVKWCLTNGYEILEGRDNDGKNPDDFLRDFSGELIPVVPFLGEEQDVDGVVHLSGMVRRARDPQRMLNYFVSAETEAIALAPKAPWVMAEGQDEGHEDEWGNSNVDNISVLHYKNVDLEGKPAPAPQRVFGEPAINAITRAKEGHIQGLKAVTGVYDASLGAQGNETSGVAIQRRQTQSSMGNFHYTDNSARSIAQIGRIVLGLVPHVYDVQRVTRILGEDGTAETVEVNTGEPVQHNGVEAIFDLTVGKYDVVVSAGPSYETKRQESRESMMALSNAFPPLIQAAGDLIIKQMDWPGATQIADRLKKMLPPELQDKQAGGPPPIPPEVQQQMQQTQQMVEQLTQALQEAQSQLESKQMELQAKAEMEQTKTEAELHMSDAQIQANMALEQAKMEFELQIKQMEIESKEKIAFAQMEADLAKTHATLQSKEETTSLQEEMKHESKCMDMEMNEKSMESKEKESKTKD